MLSHASSIFKLILKQNQQNVEYSGQFEIFLWQSILKNTYNIH